MAEGGAGRASPAEHTYPPDSLADLAVSILASTEGNQFDMHTALSTAPAATRGMRASRGCCEIKVVPQAPLPDDMPFYFGIDLHGYVLVRARHELHGWPTTRGGAGKPVRLTRWLSGAPSGSVVRHTCDTPACIRVSHLQYASQAENLADALRRGRRRGRKKGAQSARSPALRSVGAPASQAPPSTSTASRARETRFGLTGFSSPSKMARLARRARLQGSA
jgi:hypothetical protein